MSISFQSTTTSNASRENAAVLAANAVSVKTRLGLNAAVPVGGLFIAPGVQGFSQIAFVQQHNHQLQQTHQQQSQTPNSSRIPGRDRKVSRSEENRSTEV